MVTEPASDKIDKAAKGEDEPFNADHPTVPFALVLGSYPIILVVALLTILAAFWFLRR